MGNSCSAPPARPEGVPPSPAEAYRAARLANTKPPPVKVRLVAVPNAEQLTAQQVNARYEVHSIIGSGQFADVRKALRRSDSEAVALKFVDKLSLDEPDMAYISAEAEIMLALDHPNVLKCYAVLETPAHVILELELADDDLFSFYKIFNVNIM